jgi:hypothetical protein
MIAMAATIDGLTTTWLCDRCGTVVRNYGRERDVYVPALVERCRLLGKKLTPSSNPEMHFLWQSLGIAEAIGRPEATTGDVP